MWFELRHGLGCLKGCSAGMGSKGPMLNLDEAAAHGAGIFGENLSGIGNKAMQSLVLVDVTLLPLGLKENGLSSRGLNDLEHEIEKALKSLDEKPNAEINELKNNREELENSCKRIKHEH
nr:putative heat shock protein 70 family, peptide-binding domain protein [Tanacetum cinerariifolium]